MSTFLKVVNRAVNPLGFRVERDRAARFRTSDNGFTLYKFVKPDGSFDYEKYRRVQTEGNHRKIHQTFAIEENIQFLASYIRSTLGETKFGICHGTRRGQEQAWFRESLGCEVIGTEISNTATQFPNTIQWDFHEVKPEWLGSVDFIYSNAFDHSYDPEKCLNAWMSCLRPGGLCLLEHSDEHGHHAACELDPFGADLVQMPYLITNWGNGRYFVRQILRAPRIENIGIDFIVIEQREQIARTARIAAA